MVKTENFYKLGPKICTPPDLWEAKPEQPIEECRAVVVDYRKDTLREYNLSEERTSNRERIVKTRKEIESRKFNRLRKTDTV